MARSLLAAVPRVLVVTLLAALVVCVVPSVAHADPGPWRRTTPRAVLDLIGEELMLRVPAGRAWGIQSRPQLVQPGAALRVAARLDVLEQEARGAFIRVAFYARSDGRGRQRLVVDGQNVRGGEDRISEARFVVPEWAKSVKVRVLMRRYGSPLVADVPVHAWVGALEPYLGRPPPVILREVD